MSKILMNDIKDSQVEILNIIDNNTKLNPDIPTTILNSYITPDLKVSLGIPLIEGVIVKTIKLNSGSFYTKILTDYGTYILSSGNKLELIYNNNNWSVLSNEGIVLPITQKIKLLNSENIGKTNEGCSLSLSGDGNTLAVGGKSDNNNIGAVWIFKRESGNWKQEIKLIGTGYVGESKQGSSLSLSTDGNILAVGGDGDNNNTGAVWIFIRESGEWKQIGDKLVCDENTELLHQGISVSLSGDGNTLAVGGYGDNNNTGAVWIFTKNLYFWRQKGTKLVGNDSVGESKQGYSVKLSLDGNTLAVGGYGDNNNNGAVWVFKRNDEDDWLQQGKKITGYGNIGNSKQGYSVDLSSDGNTLIFGGIDDDNGIGAVWIFKRNMNLWSQIRDKLVGSRNIGKSNQGYSVKLSGDKLIAVGGISDNNNNGAVWLFTKINNFWKQTGNKLVGNENIGSSQQGYSVSLSLNGETLASGGIGDNEDNGALWIFS